jgi:FAD synthase
MPVVLVQSPLPNVHYISFRLSRWMLVKEQLIKKNERAREIGFPVMQLLSPQRQEHVRQVVRGSTWKRPAVVSVGARSSLARSKRT